MAPKTIKPPSPSQLGNPNFTTSPGSGFLGCFVISATSLRSDDHMVFCRERHPESITNFGYSPQRTQNSSHFAGIQVRRDDHQNLRSRFVVETIPGRNHRRESRIWLARATCGATVFKTPRFPSVLETFSSPGRVISFHDLKTFTTSKV